MQHRCLRNTGLKVSELAMRTQTFGWGGNEKTAHVMAGLFVEKFTRKRQSIQPSPVNRKALRRQSIFVPV